MRNIGKALMTSIMVAGVAICALPGTATAGSPLADSIAQGKHLFMTATFGGNGRHCNSCHRGGGTEMGLLPNGQSIPSLNNAAAVFPRYNPRRKMVLTLQNQVHNCVLGALQGTPPAYGSEEMTDLISYLTSLSQGKMIDMGGKPQ
jgi:thiosulfate dehydrogenase